MVNHEMLGGLSLLTIIRLKEFCWRREVECRWLPHLARYYRESADLLAQEEASRAGEARPGCLEGTNDRLARRAWEGIRQLQLD